MSVRVVPVIVACLLLVPSVARGADKTHQQMMAEIRMLQEQQAQLQQLLHGLSDTLKAMTAKIDEQTSATRKAFADQRLVIDNVAEGIRILREKADDTNVRLSTMTQEIESVRSALQSMPSPATAIPGDPNDPSAPVPSPTGTGTISPQKAYEAAFNDYTGGQYDLAIAGFEFYIKSFPTSPRADDAQLNIGNSYFAQGNFKEAVTAIQKVISDYPQSDSVPQAYYKLGQSYEALKQVDLARRAYETLLKDYPNDMTYSLLARQRLDSFTRKQD